MAHVAIVIARDGDPKVLSAMDRHLEPVEIRATTPENLCLKVAHYAKDAVLSIGDPGDGNVSVALDVAIAQGTPLAAAGSGSIAELEG